MPKRPSNFRQSDVERAVKAALNAGLAVGAVELTPDGTIRIVGANQPEPAKESPFDHWKAMRNAS